MDASGRPSTFLTTIADEDLPTHSLALSYPLQSSRERILEEELGDGEPSCTTRMAQLKKLHLPNEFLRERYPPSGALALALHAAYLIPECDGLFPIFSA